MQKKSRTNQGAKRIMNLDLEEFTIYNMADELQVKQNRLYKQLRKADAILPRLMFSAEAGLAILIGKILKVQTIKTLR
ncbi:MAG: hypothetical protein PHE33_02320 [Bacteroidales bacterium]|nr:hypothetical protein [Bacteroidales bacterium]